MKDPKAKDAPSPPALPLLVPPLRPGWRQASAGAAGPTAGRDNERRATPRVRVEVECEEVSGSSRLFRITEDLSSFGLSTRQGGSQPVGRRVRLWLHLPTEAEAVQVQAEVVGHVGQGTGMRLAFRKPSLEAVRSIHRFLAKCTGPA